MSVKGKDIARDTDDCVICLEPISEKSVASPCHHAYDYLCLLNWLEIRQSCPLCNTTIEHIDVVDTASGKVNRHLVGPPRPSPPLTRAQEFISLHHRASRRHHRLHPTTPEPITENIAILRRRFIYKHGLLSNHIGSNRISRFQSFTPLKFLRDPELQSRARNFIRRELQVFEWIQANNNNNSEFILEYCIAILKTMDLKSASGAAEDMLADFLGRENARIFLHELHAFLRSPFTNLSHFDSFAQYAVPVPVSFSDREQVELVLRNGVGEVEALGVGGTQEQQDTLVSRPGSSVGPAARNIDPGRWRKGPYSRERASGCRPRPPYDHYRPNCPKA